MHFQTHQILDVVTNIVFWASVLNLMLPPWETFNDYPGFQKKYKLFQVLLSRYAALNLRAQVAQLYPSVRNGGLNAAKTNSGGSTPSAPASSN